MLFYKWFFLWVSQSFMSLNFRHRNCVIYVYFLCWSVRNVVYTHVCTSDIRVQILAIHVGPWSWCRVLKKCLKCCSMKFWSCLGSILQQKQNCLQGSDTNLENYHMATPKVLGSFTNISHHPFSPFPICTANYKL